MYNFFLIEKNISTFYLAKADEIAIIKNTMAGMNVKLDLMDEKLNQLLKLSINTTNAPKTSVEEEVLLESITFPIKSHEDLSKLDELLINPRMKKKLVSVYKN